VPERQLAPNQLRLASDAQEDLEAVGHPIRYPRGSILFGEGEETDFALLIRKGYVKIAVGSKERIVGIRGPEEVVGELAAIEEQPRSASVYAMTDVEALYVSGSEWRKFLSDHVSVMHSLIILLAQRLRESTRKQVESGSLALERRVAMNLLELASMMGDKGVDGTVIGISQAELAGLVGTSRETVSQVMRQLRQRGIALTGRQKITICDKGKLSKISTGEIILSY
jgi:CRP/FNR family transcriptional regulator, cyclic AMP receptor protein